MGMKNLSLIIGMMLLLVVSVSAGKWDIYEEEYVIPKVNESDIDHNDLDSLQGGEDDYYFHLNNSQYSELNSEIFDWITFEEQNDLDVNSSDYWDDKDVPSDLNNLIKSDWENITNKQPSDFNYDILLKEDNITDFGDYVPYTGATDNVDLGSNNITAETLQTPSQWYKGFTNDAPDSQSCSNTASCGDLFDEDDDTEVEVSGGNTGNVDLTFEETKTLKDWKIKVTAVNSGDINIYYKEDGSWVEHTTESIDDTGWYTLSASEEHSSDEWRIEIDDSMAFESFKISQAEYEDTTRMDDIGEIKWDGTNFVINSGNKNMLTVDNNGRIEGLVPYTDAVQDLDMGDYNITTEGLGTFGKTEGDRGDYSFAVGEKIEASGDRSFAGGYEADATGNTAISIGYATTASYDRATAMGSGTTASHYISTAMGSGTTASGSISTATGDDTIASGSQATAMGRDIEVSGTNSFGIGLSSGDWDITQDHTMSVMGGNVGIGTVSPSTALEVDGDVTADDFITQSKVPDVSKGKGLDKIKNIKDWKDKDGNINYKNHYAHTKMKKENTSKIIDYEEVEECHEEDGEEVCETVEKPIYDTYEVDGLSMETRIAEMEKMIYELQEQNECLATKQDSKEKECLK
ncbi:MAG: hypothetical protein ACOC1X_00625 [Promethearchaeota archaeon]